jgi:predicted ATPase
LPDGGATGPAAVRAGAVHRRSAARRGPLARRLPVRRARGAAIEALRLDAPVTLLAGDNGTGKSTLIEALAEAMDFAA